MAQTELSVVIPVYNEAGNLEKLISDWETVFQSQNINSRFIFINDGSTDESAAVLKTLQEKYEHIISFDQANSGHGAAVLKGYREALSSEWIFQVDSDHQYATDVFTDLWDKRGSYDFLIGERKEINASLSRKMISLACSKAVRLICGKKISDVNVPYRLIKGTLLGKCLEKIPGNSFAPNVLMSALVIKAHIPIYTSELLFRKSIVPNKSRLSHKLFKGSIQTFLTLFKI